MNRTLEQILSDRGIPASGDGVAKFGKMYSIDSEFSSEDMADACKALGKAEGEFDKTRIITFVASDETVDSYGDILRVDGCDLTRFKSGSAAFICSHDLSDIDGACGVIINAKKAKGIEGSPDGKAILVSIYFPTEEEDESADKIFKKYKARTLNAVSVGLKVIEYFDPPADSAERKALGLGKWGIEVRKWMPYELSAVTVGANPNALMRRAFAKENEELSAKIEQLTKTVTMLVENLTEKQKTNESGKENNPEAVRSYLALNPIKIAPLKV